LCGCRRGFGAGPPRVIAEAVTRALTIFTVSCSFFIIPIAPLSNSEATSRFRSYIIFAHFLITIVSAKFAVSEHFSFFFSFSRDLAAFAF